MAFRVLKPAAIVTFLTAMVISPAVFAHAHLTSQQPAGNSTVPTAPSQLVLNFSEGIEPGFSGVAVMGPDKRKVATGNVRVAANKSNQMVVPLNSVMAGGEYQVDWHVVSVDGHKTRGSYRFTVK